MKRLLAVVIISSLSVTANAQIFKCAKLNGGVEFSSIPCNADKGEASLALKNQWQPDEKALMDAEAVHQGNKLSTAIMRLPKPKAGGLKVGIVKDSSAPVTTNDILRSRIERRAAAYGAPQPQQGGVTVIRDSNAPVTTDDMLRSKNGLD